MPRNLHPVTTVSSDGQPAYIRPARNWDVDAKLADPHCVHCGTHFRFSDPVWIRNEIGLLAPVCQNLDECSARSKGDEAYHYDYRWDVFYAQILAATGIGTLQGFEPHLWEELTYEIEEIRVLVEHRGLHELVNPEAIRQQLSEELLCEVHQEDKYEDPSCPGLSLRQRAWSMWRHATVNPDPNRHPYFLDVCFLASQGDERCLKATAAGIRAAGVPVYDAPKPNKGRERKQARKKNAARSRANAR